MYKTPSEKPSEKSTKRTPEEQLSRDINDLASGLAEQLEFIRNEVSETRKLADEALTIALSNHRTVTQLICGTCPYRLRNVDKVIDQEIGAAKRIAYAQAQEDGLDTLEQKFDQIIIDRVKEVETKLVEKARATYEERLTAKRSSAVVDNRDLIRRKMQESGLYALLEQWLSTKEWPDFAGSFWVIGYDLASRIEGVLIGGDLFDVLSMYSRATGNPQLFPWTRPGPFANHWRYCEPVLATDFQCVATEYERTPRRLRRNGLNELTPARMVRLYRFTRNPATV